MTHLFKDPEDVRRERKARFDQYRISRNEQGFQLKGRLASSNETPAQYYYHVTCDRPKTASHDHAAFSVTIEIRISLADAHPITKAGREPGALNLLVQEHAFGLALAYIESGSYESGEEYRYGISVGWEDGEGFVATESSEVTGQP